MDHCCLQYKLQSHLTATSPYTLLKVAFCEIIEFCLLKETKALFLPYKMNCLFFKVYFAKICHTS